MIWVSRRRVQRWDQGSWRRRGQASTGGQPALWGGDYRILLVQAETKKEDRKPLLETKKKTGEGRWGGSIHTDPDPNPSCPLLHTETPDLSPSDQAQGDCGGG